MVTPIPTSMNVYVTNINPVKSAEALDDRLIVTQVLEVAHIMCSALHLNNAGNKVLYGPVYTQRPHSHWCALSKNNFRWMYHYGNAASEEHYYRNGMSHHHGSTHMIHLAWKTFNENLVKFPETRLRPFLNMTPYRGIKVTDAYRRYLAVDRWGHDTKWTKRGAPSWIEESRKAA